jgi:hypothetical protein
MAKEYRKTYVKVTDQSKNSDGSYNISVDEDALGTLNISFKINDEKNWKTGEGQYGPWCLCGNIDIAGYIDDGALFASYDFNDKSKITGFGTKIRPGSYLTLFLPKPTDDFDYNLYIKTVVEDTSDNPF